MQEIHKKEMRERLSPYMSILKKKSVIIFGHCNGAEELVSYFQSESVAVDCFLDNNLEKQGKYHGEIPILAPSAIQRFSATDSIVCIITRYFHEMASQLRGFGYEGEIVEVVEFQSFQAFSVSDSVFQNKCERVKQGAGRLAQIKADSGNAFLILCPYRALGDVYWAMAYLPAFLQKRNIEQVAIAVVGNPCKQVAALFGYEQIFSFQQKEMDALVQAVVFTHEEEAWVAHHGPLYFDGSLRLLHQQFLPFTQFYRDVVYGLSSHVEAVIPHRQSPLSAEIKAQIKPQNTLIIAPYAHSVVGVPWVFWENLVLEYQQKGFLVLTNVAPEEKPIEGSTGLCLTLGEMKSAVEWAGHFIGLRSGLCDLLHSANCEKTLIFSDSYFWSTKHHFKDFYALDGWQTQLVLP